MEKHLPVHFWVAVNKILNIRKVMIMRRYIISGILALLFFIPINSFANNVLYINGIKNTLEDAEKSRKKIEEVLNASENHSGNELKTFFVWGIWNPIGFHGEKAYLESELNQDRKELFLLKTSEEEYGEDFQKIMVPFNLNKSVDAEAATRVIGYLDDMTPGSNDPNDTATLGSNSLEAEGLVSDEDMLGTQIAVQKLVSAIKNLGSAVVVAHSQGNLLANLAYAKIVSEFGDDASEMVRVVNVANTSEFSVNSLNFTHAGDEALYSDANWTFDKSIETLPSLLNTWRYTSECNWSDCNFTVAPPTFEAYTGGGFPWLSHGLVDVYLSEDVVYVRDDQGVAFTSGADRFVDRFEDFVYAAAESLELAGVEPPVEPPVENYFKTVVGTVDVGDGPLGIAIADGYAYVVNEGGNSVSVIRLLYQSVVDVIDVGEGPYGVAISNEYAYVTNSNSDSVSVIRLSDRTVISTIRVSNGPMRIAISNGYAYVSTTLNSSVSVIRLSDRTVIDVIKMGYRPHGIAISNGYAYVTDSYENFVLVIRLLDRFIVDTISTGSNPYGIAISNEHAYVVNRDDDSVAILTY